MSLFTLPKMASLDPDHGPNIADLWRSLSEQQQDHSMVLVEGEGGLGSPVVYDSTIAALARDWRLPTILVMPMRREAIAATVGAIALARHSRLDLLGVILNQSAPSTDFHDSGISDLLRSLTQVPILGTLPFLDDLDNEGLLSHAASNLMIEAIFGQPVLQETA